MHKCIGPRMAICYWGLTRSTRLVYESHEIHIFAPLRKRNVCVTVFMHTWSTRDGRQRERNVVLDTPIDYLEYKFLRPNFFRRDSQEAFIDTLTWSLYYYKHTKEWHPVLLLNHLCELESLRRVFHMVKSAAFTYGTVVFLRPDLWIQNDLPVALPIRGEIILKREGGFEGYNDQFAMLTYADAYVYAERINALPAYRRQHRHIVAEAYLKFACDNHSLHPTWVRFGLVKVRAPRLNGTMHIH